MQNESRNPLIDVEDLITTPLFLLMLTGRGTPFLHNGIMEADESDTEGGYIFTEGKQGVMARNDLGFILWKNNEEKTMNYNLGSRLKTPVLPIWVTCINNEWGVLFNPNRDLMKSYSAENRFHLFYYSNGSSDKKDKKNAKDTMLVIDTRGKQAVTVVEKTPIEEDTDVEQDPLELAIRTKWGGAVLDWGGEAPYI